MANAVSNADVALNEEFKVEIKPVDETPVLVQNPVTPKTGFMAKIKALFADKKKRNLLLILLVLLSGYVMYRRKKANGKTNKR